VTHLVIDATGLKVFGAGEWRQKHYSLEKRRVWRKLHIAVDPSTHAIVYAEVSVATVSDNEVLPTLVNPLRRRVEQISAEAWVWPNVGAVFISCRRLDSMASRSCQTKADLLNNAS
jgi:hypothetical protein